MKVTEEISTLQYVQASATVDPKSNRERKGQGTPFLWQRALNKGIKRTMVQCV